MSDKKVFVFASSRRDGEAGKILDYVVSKTNYPVIDLTTKKIAYWDYEFNNKGDDFLPIARDIAENYDEIIYVTPVYWYMMCAQMKTFFDRLYDLFTLEKETGRKWKRKTMSVITCGEEKFVEEGFIMPFVETGRWMKMNYRTDVHTWLENNEITDEVKKKLDEFIADTSLRVIAPPPTNK